MFPPDKGGLPDHTLGLAESFLSFCDSHEAINSQRQEMPGVDVLTRKGEIELDQTGAQSSRLRIHPELSNWRHPQTVVDALEKVLTSGEGLAGRRIMIIWQYVPHMYGRAGINLQVPNFLKLCRKQIGKNVLEGSLEQWVIAHEITASLSWRPGLALAAMAHRWQWSGLLRAADRVGVSTEAWIERWVPANIRNTRPVFLAPSPSMIPVAALGSGTDHAQHAENWKRQKGVKSGAPMMLFFGSLGGPKQLDWVVESWRASRREAGLGTLLAVVGGKPELALDPDEMKDYLPLGYLSSEEVSLALQAADLITLPFIDGVSERRTSFMAGIAHGKTVLTTIGSSTGPSLRSSCGTFFAGADVLNQGEYIQKAVDLLRDEDLRSAIGKAAQVAYYEQMDWPVVWQRALSL